MTLIEFFGQGDNLTLFIIGILIVLVIYLLKRVSVLSKKLAALEAHKAEYVPMNAPQSLGGPVAVPNAVIAAICAAVDQYQLENA